MEKKSPTTISQAFPSTDTLKLTPSWLELPVVVWKALATLTFAIALYWMAPLTWLILLCLNTLVAILLYCLRLWATRAHPPDQNDNQHVPTTPFVSIHVPTCNEPPEVVAKTLRCLARLDYPAFEVIVFDNNTTDQELWLPIEELCDSLGSRFRFFHREGVQGFKAGALNICLSLVNPQTEYIAVVDADYCVYPDFLLRGINHFATGPKELSHVQFPQAYYNADDQNLGLQDEYAHYFEGVMPSADASNTCLLTGTLCLVRKQALEEVGGWSSESLTEDAEMGVRFYAHGYRGRFAAEVVGRGLMPTDLRSLRSQRRRWVYGNAQSLCYALNGSLKEFSWRQKLGVVLQLTAWFNFLALPLLSLVLLAHFALLRTTTWDPFIAAVATLHIFLFVAITPLRFWSIRSRQEQGQRSVVGSTVAHFGLVLESAFGWLECLLGGQLKFQRTNKFFKPDSWIELWPHALLVLLLAEAASVLWIERFYVAGSAALVAALVVAQAFTLKKRLNASRA